MLTVLIAPSFVYADNVIYHGLVYRSEWPCNVDFEFQQLADHTNSIRTVVTNHDLYCFEKELKIAPKYGLKIMPTIILEGHDEKDYNTKNMKLISEVINKINKNPESSEKILLGQSMLYDYRLSTNELIEYVKLAKQNLTQPIPVSVFDAQEVWMDPNSKQLLDVVDFVYFDDFTIWQLISRYGEDVTHIVNNYYDLSVMIPDKEIIVETGLPYSYYDRDYRGLPIVDNLDHKNNEKLAKNLNSQNVSYYIYEGYNRTNELERSLGIGSEAEASIQQSEKYFVYIEKKVSNLDSDIFVIFGNEKRSYDFLVKLQEESNGNFYPNPTYVSSTPPELLSSNFEKIENEYGILIPKPNVVNFLGVLEEELKEKNPIIAAVIAATATSILVLFLLITQSTFTTFAMSHSVQTGYLNMSVATRYRRSILFKRTYIAMAIGSVALALYHLSVLWILKELLTPLLLVFYACALYFLIQNVKTFSFCKVSLNEKMIITILTIVAGLASAAIFSDSFPNVFQDSSHNILSIVGMFVISPLAIYAVLSYRKSILHHVWTMIGMGLIFQVIGIMFGTVGNFTNNIAFLLPGTIIMGSGMIVTTIGLVKFRRIYQTDISITKPLKN